MLVDSKALRLKLHRSRVSTVRPDSDPTGKDPRASRGDRPSPDLKDRIVILIDDGLATGSTMRAVAQAVRQHHPARLVVAVPTAAVETCEEFRSEVDEVICAVTPAPFYAVGLWYEEFSQTSDEEVRDLLARAHSVAVHSGGRWERQ